MQSNRLTKVAVTVCKKSSPMAVNLVSWFSFDKQILYLLKIIFAQHLQTEAD